MVLGVFVLFLCYNISMTHTGAVNFALHKIRSKNHPRDIADMLVRMGYNNEQISAILIEAGKNVEFLNQEIVEANDFLPPLNDLSGRFFEKRNIEILNAINNSNATDLYGKVTDEENLNLPPYPAINMIQLKNIKYKKRLSLPRHPFIFKLLHSLSIAILGVILGYILIKISDPGHIFALDLMPVYWAARISSPSFFILVLSALLYLLYILHLFVRRLHDAGINPWTALLLFTPILPFIANLSEIDTKIMFGMSLVPFITVFIISALTPSHNYKV